MIRENIILVICLFSGFLQADDNKLCTYEIYASLKTLICPPNSIREFPRKIHNDTQFLRLAKNQIRTLPSNLSAIVPNLEKLDLSNNDLSTLSYETFKDLKSLISVNVLRNNISSIEANIFYGVQSSYVHLNLRGNIISRINKDAFTGLYGETSIDLDGNNLESVDQETFTHMRNLIILKLGRNKIKTLSSKLFTNQQKLFYLLFNAGINSVAVLAMSRQNNNLYSMLRELSSNQLENLSEDVFQGLSSLETLFLNGNKLKNLPYKLFRNTPNLRKILLEDNAFSYPPENLPSKVKVALSRNPLNCDCQLKKMLYNTSLANQIIDMDRLTCNNTLKVVDALTMMDCTPPTTATIETTSRDINTIEVNKTTTTTTPKNQLIIEEYEGSSKTVVILTVVFILMIVIVGAVLLYICRRNVVERVNMVKKKFQQRHIRETRLHSSADDIVANGDHYETKTAMFVKTECDV